MVEQEQFVLAKVSAVPEFYVQFWILNYRSKLLHHTSSSSGSSLDFGTSNKHNCGWNAGLLVENQSVTSADVKKVTCRKELELLAQLYSSCIAGKGVGSFGVM